MIKIAYCSDLHLDIDKTAGLPTDFEFPEADVLILAGDVGEIRFLRAGMYDTYMSHNIRDFLDRVSTQYKRVLWISGNHEYYGSSFFEAKNIVYDYFREVGITNIDFGEMIEHMEGDCHLIGATLWTDVNKADPMAIISGGVMNDYREIDAGTFTPVKSIEKHYEHKNFLYERLTDHNTGMKNRVVFTHHAPHYRSDSNITRVTPYYCCTDMEDVISAGWPSVWIHGHTHFPIDYFIHATRVLSNPRGYVIYETLPKYFSIEVVEV
jgi:Icc-related predicted phosphoesterase